MYNTSHCEHCGHKELTVKHTYVLRRTFESWVPCLCKKRKDGIAAQHSYIMPETWDELGYLDDGRSKIYERTLVEKLPVEEIKRKIHCQGCADEASENDWETEQVGDAETIQGPDAWRMYCHRCNTEVPFGWTAPDRQGFLVPMSTLKDEPRQVWVDPGFEYQQTSRRT